MFLENPCLLEWFRTNAEKDEDDKTKLIKSVIDELKPWLNVELYSKVEKTKKSIASKKAFMDNLKSVADKDTLSKISKIVEK